MGQTHMTGLSATGQTTRHEEDLAPVQSLLRWWHVSNPQVCGNSSGAQERGAFCSYEGYPPVPGWIATYKARASESGPKGEKRKAYLK